jgi:hypothetical protein
MAKSEMECFIFKIRINVKNLHNPMNGRVP